MLQHFENIPVTTARKLALRKKKNWKLTIFTSNFRTWTKTVGHLQFNFVNPSLTKKYNLESENIGLTKIEFEKNLYY